MSNPELCNKIYPRAMLPGTIEHIGPNDLRSRCFYQAAVSSGEARYCDEITSLPHPRSKLAFTRESCRTDVAHHDLFAIGGTSLGGTLPEYLARNLLMQMGYTRKEIPEALLPAADDANMWLEFYKSIAASADFRERLKKSPDYSKDATTVTTLSCERPQVLRPGVVNGPMSKSCCWDMNDDGRCDFDENEDRDGRFCEGLEVRFVDGSPTRTLCGGESFDVELDVRNTRTSPVPRGAAVVQLMGISPSALGKPEAELVLPVPEVPPGGEARVQFPGLVYKSPLGEGNTYIEFSAAIGRSHYCNRNVQTTSVVQPPSGPGCVATRRMYEEPPCAPPYALDKGASDSAAKCCFDLDRDGICDARGWASTRVAVGDVRVLFPAQFPLEPVRAGVPFHLEVILENGSDAPVPAGAGLIQLVAYPANVIANPQTDLVKLLPGIPPGGKAVLTFSGLRYRNGPEAHNSSPGQQTGLHTPPNLLFYAVLCMRGGCSSEASFVKQVAGSAAQH